MKVLLSDGTNIYYEIHGNKKNRTLIFLHGNMEDSSFFLNQINYFKDKYQVLVLDSRGHGKSGWGDLRAYSIKQMAKDLGELLNILKLKDYYIVGFSDGANIGMEFGSKQPERLKGLVLIGGNLRPTGMKLGVVLEIVKDYFLTIGLAEGFLTRKKLGLMLFEPKINFKEIELIKVPTLVMAGEFDLIKKSETLKIASLIKDSQVIFIEKGNHYFIYNKPNYSNKMLEDWINSV